jgi:hypothetical protein
MVPVLKSHLQIYNQLIVIYFTLLYDFLTSKAVKCFVCFEESDQKAINPNSTALGVTLFVLVVLIMFICLKTESKLGELFYDKLKCCGEFVWCCLTCQCLRDCCTTLVSRVGGHSARSHSDNMATEMNEIPEA